MKVIGNLTKDAIIRAAVSEGINVTQVIGSTTTFESAATELCVCIYDSGNQKIVIGYADAGNSSYGTAVVGTVSGTSISFGTPVAFTDKQIRYLSGAYDSNAGKVVFSYAHDSNKYGTGIVGTVSGTSISFGSDEHFEQAAIESTSTVYDVNAQKIVVSYRDDGNSNYGTAVVGTVSGTSITYGTPVVFQSSAAYYYANVYEPNAQKVVIGYRDDVASSAGTAIVGTVSGTSISFGTKQAFESGNTTYISGDYDTVNQKVVYAYQDSGNSSHGTAVVGTVSGTSISFGSPVVFASSSTAYVSCVYDASAQRFVIGFADSGNSAKGTAVVGEVSGTSISFNSTFLFKDANQISFISLAYHPVQEKVVFGFRNNASSNHGQSLVYKTGYSSATGGTIADGKAVVVNANGTVSSISQSSISQALGSKTVFESATTEYTHAVFDSYNNKVVFTYKDDSNSNYGTAVVGTVSGDSISFGTPVVYESSQVRWQSPVFDSTNNKVVIAYRKDDDGGDGAAIVGTVSGTSISFGSSTEFESGEVLSNSIPLTATFDSNEGKVVIAYSRSSSTDLGRAVVGTVSGTSISFGSLVTFQSSAITRLTSTFDSNLNKVVIFYRASSEGKAIVGTVSGTSISFGSAVTFTTDTFDYPAATFDSSNNKIVLSYQNGSDVTGVANVGTVSGTSISFGSDVVFRSKNVTFLGTTFDSNANKVIVTYRNSTDSLGELVVGTVSGTSISFASEGTFNTDNTRYTSATFDSNQNKVVIGFKDHGNSSYGTAIVFQNASTSTNLTTENFVGFMDGAALDGTNGEILSSCSIARNQTSLTPGQTYFVTPAGALSTTAGSPSVTAGTAISSTELIVKG